LELEQVKVSVSEEQVKEALSRLQESYARLEPVENRMVVQRGDFVTLDFEGFIDGKAFAAGKGENYVLEVGGGRALPQFEDAVTGLPLGERRTIQVVYPENYPNREISGKLVEFSVIVREIKQKVLPALDDDFAKDHGECSSLDELRATVRTRLENELKQIQQEELKEQIVNRLLDAESFMPPPAMVDRQTRYLMERYQSQGTQPSGPSLEETRKTLEARATRQVQATLVIEKIAQLEKIEVSDKEVQERVDALARAAGDRGKTVREVYSKPEARDDLRAQIVFDRTVSFLLERARVKEGDPPATKVDEQGKKG
jgi:trigger factor